MTSYIGLPGALVPIVCPVSEDMTPERAVSVMVPFDGRRVVQLGRRVRRSWSVDYGVEHPRDYAVLGALASAVQSGASRATIAVGHRQAAELFNAGFAHSKRMGGLPSRLR